MDDSKEPIQSIDNSQQPENLGQISTQTPKPTKQSKFTALKNKIKGLSKNTKLAIVLSVALVLIGITAFIMTRKDNSSLSSEEAVVVVDEQEEQTLGAVVILKEGTLEIKQPESDWEDAKTDEEIVTGTSLRTVGATSRSVISFDDGSVIRLDANSEVEFESMTTDRIAIRHISGYTYNRVLPSENLSYIVMSTDAQYEAQGTAFRTTATGDEQSVEVFQSSVLETNLNKSPKTGEKLTVINKLAPASDGKIDKLDIETIKNDSFIQWNLDLDKKDDKFKNDLGFLSDTTAPEITFTITDGEVILLEPTASEGTVEISGSTEAGGKITVLSKSQNGAQPIEVSVGSDGKFTTPVLSAPLGNSVFEFVVKDRNGNTTTKTLRVTFQRKSQPVSNTTGIVLKSTTNDSDNKLKLEWSFNGSTKAPDGVKIVIGKSANPVFGGSGVESIYAENGTSKTIEYNDLFEGETNYIKACIYDGASGTCGLYSNQIVVDIP